MIGNLIEGIKELNLNKKKYFYWLHLNYLEEIKQHSNTTFIKANSRDQIHTQKELDTLNFKNLNGGD